ncbi:MAG: hypothetical protein ACLS6Y_05105 [Streptococcus salivarius]
MTKTEVIQRLQKDLGIPRFQAYIEDKDYSEESRPTKKILKATSPTTFQTFQQILKADWIINNLYLKIIYHHVTNPLATCIRLGVFLIFENKKPSHSMKWL